MFKKVEFIFLLNSFIADRSLWPSISPGIPTTGQTTGARNSANKSSREQRHSCPDPLSPLNKISMLLTDAPKALQADVIALVPDLIAPEGHTGAAGTLLSRLAVASRECPDDEVALRLPVLAALGSLCIDPSVASKVLQAALEALPLLSASELPPAVGLILKLASTSVATCTSAIMAVRKTMHETAAGVQQDGAIDALRLSVMQHTSVAMGVLAAIRKEWHLQQGPSIAEVEHDHGPDHDHHEQCPPGDVNADQHNLLTCDIEVLLDCLGIPQVREEAINIFLLATRAALITADQISKRILRRNSACRCGDDTASNCSQSMMMVSSKTLIATSGSVAVACFTSAQSAELSRFESVGEATNESDLGLRPLGNKDSSSSRAEFVAMLPQDDLGGLLAVGHRLLLEHHRNPNLRLVDMGRSIFQAAFEVYKNDERGRQRVLSKLARVGLSGLDRTGNGDSDIQTVVCTILASFESPTVDIIKSTFDIAGSLIRAHQTAEAQISAAVSRQVEELAAQRAATVRAETAEKKIAEAMTEIETQINRQAAEHRAQVAGLNSDIRDLQAKVRASEQQMEWIRSERDDERALRTKEQKEAAQRESELEAQLNRLKISRRDEQKKAAREKSTLADRVRELEDSLERINSEASMAANRNERALLELRQRLEIADKTLHSKGLEISTLQSAIKERDRQLQAALEAQRSLEQVLGVERQRTAAIMASHRSSREGPQAIGALLGQPKGPTGAFHSRGRDMQPVADGIFSGGGNQIQLTHSAHHGSLDSVMNPLTAASSDRESSMDGTSGLHAGGLFGPASLVNWGQNNNHNSNGLIGAPNSASSSFVAGQQDENAATIERLLGLLPSDLLHS